MIERQNLFPEALSKRVVGGHVLYSPVVTVVAGKLIFVSGLLARNQAGEIVGKGDMGGAADQHHRRGTPPLASGFSGRGRGDRGY
jgi:enamine deaminase RidA (YjgF/YER057c/UK114 family)